MKAAKNRMRQILAILGAFALVLFCFSCGQSEKMTQEIKSHARKASVQTVFHVPVLKVTFTEPLPEEEKDELTTEKVKTLLEEQKKELELKLAKDLKESLEKQRKEIEEGKYESVLTPFTVYEHEPHSRTAVVLGTITPENVTFPEKVLVVAEVKEDEEYITAWEKEYEKDVLTISETINVSPTKAKELISNLSIHGYTVNKKKIEVSDNVKLLWFDGGWNDNYPMVLNWSVKVHGKDTNIITGYDPRGILEIRPIGEDEKINVVAGYHDLMDKYKEKSTEMKELEIKIDNLNLEIERLEEAIEEKNKKIEELTPEEEAEKRDISKVTFWDVYFGNVKLEVRYFVTAASGMFLGNMRVDNEMYGYQGWRGWGDYQQYIKNDEKAAILTNAHVAYLAVMYEVYVSRDKETMWILLPGVPFVRYTKSSDHFGTPAALLSIDGEPIMSYDYDCGVMVTTAVPQYEINKVSLGDSDNVKEGDPVVMVGNPAMCQKFTTEGIISNTDYSLLNRLDSARWFKYMSHKVMYNWIKNTKFWIDAPIGIGGTSGSGIWALSGKEKGKVVSLHNAGLVSRFSNDSLVSSKAQELDYKIMECEDRETKVEDVVKNNISNILEKYSCRDVTYDSTIEEFSKIDEDFDIVLEQCCNQRVAGMSIGIAINDVKMYLQERGLDPEHFNWDELPQEYFEQ